MVKKCLGYLLVVLGTFLMTLPGCGTPQKTLVCISGESWLEQHAAEELAKYIAEMTGSTPEISQEAGLAGYQTVLSVGRSQITNSLMEQGLVELPQDLGEDGFILKSVSTEGVEYLVICGGSPSGTLSGVYYYLENLCKVGFFWDGEQVPSLVEIPLQDLEIVEIPRFPERQYLLSVVYGYTTYWWDWDEWKREIDWAAKHRFNIMHPPPGAVDVWRKVWSDFGVEVPPSSLSPPPFLPWASFHLWNMKPPYPDEFQKFMGDLRKKMIDYGRSIGIKWDSPAMAGIQVPREFYEAFKDRANFMDVEWYLFPAAQYVHPVDPLYGELWKAFMREYKERYGTDHLWWAPSFFEMRPGEDLPARKQLELKKEIAAKTVEATKTVDPEAKLILLGWTFTDRKYWPKEHAKAFLETFPDDSVRIYDLWQDYAYPNVVQQPIYEELDYYFGKPWLIGFLHSYGGDLSLHGNLADTIRRVQQVAQVRQGNNVKGLSVQMEVLNHNYVFYDLLSRLAWNPVNVDLQSFLDDYVVRRYGEESAPRMRDAFEHLAKSVYSTGDTTSPLYMFRLLAGHRAVTSEQLRRNSRLVALTFSERGRFLPDLQEALRIALEERTRLGESPLYQHDLIDTARQFLGDLFNLRVIRLHEAFQAGDMEAFDQEAEKLKGIMESQEMLLSSCDYFCLQPILEKAKALPGAPDDYDERIRDILTVWADKINDYARRDYYELVRFYYRGRVDAFIAHLREQLNQGSEEIDADYLAARYDEIEQRFVKEPFQVKPGDRFQGTPAEAAARVLEAHRVSQEELEDLL